MSRLTFPPGLPPQSRVFEKTESVKKKNVLSQSVVRTRVTGTIRMPFKPIRLLGTLHVCCRFLPISVRQTVKLSFVYIQRTSDPYTVVPSGNRGRIGAREPVFALCFRHQHLVITTMYVICADSRRARVLEKKIEFPPTLLPSPYRY